MNIFKKIIKEIIVHLKYPINQKKQRELAFWIKKKIEEKELNYAHYQYFYFDHFKLNRDDLIDKKILDVGCGPRGSLEWANMAYERIGLDPLADSYRSLGINKHKMEYICGQVENMPFKSNSFDIVSSINSLDHVDNIDNAIQEIVRVVKPGGFFLLLVEVNHPPRTCEPITFSWDIVKEFLSKLAIIEEKHYKRLPGMIQSIQADLYDHSNNNLKPGILSVKFRKT